MTGTGNGSTLQLNSEGADDLGVAFSTGGSYAAGIWDIQTVDDSFSVDLNVLTFGNATQVRYAVPAAGQSVLAGIETGDFFIIALRTPLATELTGQDTNIEIDLSQGGINAFDPNALRLSDFNQDGLTTIHALALIEIEVDGAYLYADSISQNADTGSLEDGELELTGTLTIGGLQRFSNSMLRLRRTVGSTSGLSAFFGNSGTDPDARVYIQTDRAGTTRFGLTKGSQGSGLSNWDVLTDNQSVYTGLVTGDRILFAVAEPAPVAPVTGSPAKTRTSRST